MLSSMRACVSDRGGEEVGVGVGRGLEWEEVGAGKKRTPIDSKISFPKIHYASS